MFKLTIAIPTFNRNAQLLDTVTRLLPQLTGECRLIILDNHSPTPVADSLSSLIDAHPQANCTIIRHPLNIGGNVNIMRCFELCETSWLWVLGDDDEVRSDAIALIFQTISEYPDLTYVNFSSEICNRSQSFITTGLEEFAVKIDYFGNAMFISASLYNFDKVRSHFAHASHYGYSCAAQVLIVILSLREGDRCLFSNKKIVHWECPPPEHAYSVTLASIGRATLLEVPMPSTVRNALAKSIRESAYSLRQFARELFYTGVRNNDLESSRYLYDQLTYRIYYFDRDILTRIKIWVYRLPLRAPRVFHKLNVWSASLLGRRILPQHPVGRSDS